MQVTYKYIVIEDNPIDRKILNECLQKLPHLKLIDTFQNPIDAIQTIHSNTVDIIFMDIEMPEMSGLGLLNSLEKIPIVILISNHIQYAMEAFEMGVTDYIQKPFTFERLLKAISRGIELLNLQNRSIQELTAPKDNFIFLKAGRELLKFNLNDILYIEALASFTKIFTEDKISVISESISDLHAKLPPNSFLRVHKSYLVPFSKIIGISTKNVILENHKIPLGLSYRERIEKVLAGNESIRE
ncbi:LytTR family DNA-binding domain-containing protein [Arcicella sp. LKC2W]|uniref:LytR/AlgR family response regulator transcription factor n=1 Tax=Arcicella sp. LKC2W TaxID=2984198 RepID=UPI002B2103DD|nr:LytTR family DNA-binding domain-containing protein [Arcicella sp. LKC2W]MEA5461027.1 LytTR family DNA-binding domain-containing protein [Arcicella sp. LKC2W]